MVPHTLLLAWLLAPTWGLSLNAPFRMVPSRVAARTLGHWRLHEHIHAEYGCAKCVPVASPPQALTPVVGVCARPIVP